MTTQNPSGMWIPAEGIHVSDPRHPQYQPPHVCGSECVHNTNSAASDARPGWLQKMAKDVNARQARPDQLAAEIVDISHTHYVPDCLVQVCLAYDRRDDGEALRLGRKEAGEEIAEAIEACADDGDWGVHGMVCLQAAADIARKFGSQPSPDATSGRTDPGDPNG